jgi:uncharacterized protein
MSNRPSPAELPDWLLKMLACPDTHHAPLGYDRGAQTLSCPECGRVFPVRDGVPVLLLSGAATADAS